ncbi:MAG: flagellar assembly protein FliW [Betaproteobacteria bacterium]|jgi:flagellar assembly factor FliW|uniref:Flagellar assembly factor FliW n=1 Tax=Candidatus Proximibacter danicus TaxID=2954365 RepID=A0A9D7PP40_9PROT|nr:flagellar assembly protein FliW [Candidatus Proximibacter danicus]MBK9445498.1 flagellar assembly protein FliW [Betaproteobacteria bacterium]
MKIDIDQYGLKDVQVNPDAAFTFPQGLAGFEQNTRYSLFHEEGKPTVFLLQSLDDPTLAFSVVPPELLDIEYEIELSDEDAKLIDLKDPKEAVVVVIVYREAATDAGGGKIAASARSPLVLNSRSRLGMQKILREVHPSLVYRGS